jgi:hypothetical protein
MVVTTPSGRVEVRVVRLVVRVRLALWVLVVSGA